MRLKKPEEQWPRLDCLDGPEEIIGAHVIAGDLYVFTDHTIQRIRRAPPRFGWLLSVWWKFKYWVIRMLISVEDV